MKTGLPIDAEDVTVIEGQSERSSFGKTIWREIKGDKMAIIALFILSIILLVAYIAPLFIDQVQAARTNFMQIYEKPSKDFWLGTDRGGRDIFVQLVIGARNSITIGAAITLIAGFLGLMIGLISVYFGGKVDFVIIRSLDFLLVFPTLILFIFFVFFGALLFLILFPLVCFF